jgi:4-amino-4-deoxy-L-arabinose transferase-like glycosyltransferase
MKKDISIILVCLIVIVFFIRIGSFSKEHNLTYDEVVYSTLAVQIIENPANYNTIGLYRRDSQEGRELPEYFKKPLFKHPPLFPQFITVSYGLFGRTYFSAFKVSLFFGILLIALAYLLGSTLFDSRTGAYAALLMAIEPVIWISSQKIWMETTLAFFTVLALYLFIRSVKKYNPYFMIASGISAGFAVLIKYPGILSTGMIFLYALCSERWLFRKKTFILSLFIPFIMLIPWLEWNYRIYGAELFSTNVEINQILGKISLLVKNFWGVFCLAALISACLIVIKKKFPDIYGRVLLSKLKVLKWIFIVVLFCAIVFMLRIHIINALNLVYVPRAGWKMGMFYNEPWYFYLGRLVELSPFYIFSFTGLLLLVFDERHLREYSFLFFVSAVILAFYILWGNYQCRYISAAVVPLMILSSKTQLYIADALSRVHSRQIRYMVYACALLIVAYMALKTLRTDIILAVPNNICYF